jgi:hypothetical protein
MPSSKKGGFICPCALGQRGGGCGCNKNPAVRGLYGGYANGHDNGHVDSYRGYRATRKNKNLFKKYKAGISIGFTGRASLKAKGILPRSNGRYILGPKYSGNKKPRILKKPTKTRKQRK